ncbi:MAG: TraR/DksA C4-type zinc finger protein [Anderseniella sp.]|jgi:DnaK suppressor protein|nr:TraR/DksA C4-type zinc finger protein [Anderseniella sp.]
MPGAPDSAIEAAREKLEARREELRELSSISARDRNAVELDQQSVGRLSRMDAMQRQAMAQANERARAAEMTRIEQALRRIEDGEYGWCLTCGEAIAPKRLEIDPAAAVCVACAGGPA